MSHLYIDVLCAESHDSELIDAAEAVAAISEVLDSDWKWTRLNVGRGPTDEFDVSFYDVLASNDTKLSGEEVKSILLRCARRGLRRCSLDMLGLHVVDDGEEYPRIDFYCLEVPPSESKRPCSRLDRKLHILIEPRSFFESKKLANGTLVENEAPWGDWLMQIFMAIARKVRPRTMHMYLEQEWALPINSHFSYFASADEVIQDLELIRTAWAKGLDSLYEPIGPLGKRESFPQLKSLSPYRSDEWIERMIKQFDTAFCERERVTDDDVQRVLESNRFDTLTPSDDVTLGFAVTDIPWFLESWIDRFYLDVLGYEWWKDYSV